LKNMYTMVTVAYSVDEGSPAHKAGIKQENCSIRLHTVQILYGYDGEVTDSYLFFVWIEVSSSLIPECLLRPTIAARTALPGRFEL
jgi:hypothetical protein